MAKKNIARKTVFTLATLGLLGIVARQMAQNNRKRDKDNSDNTEQQAPEQSTDTRDFMTMAMEDLYPEVFVGVEELETNRQTPKKQPRESRYTYWNGLTWVYTVDKKGNIHQHPCTGQYKDMAAKMTREQREEQFRLHLQFETFQRLKTNVEGKTHINHNMMVALCMAGYQLPGHMADIASRLDKATNTQEIMDAFKYKLPTGESWRVGTLKRRWWCGAYAAGLITAEDLLSLPKDAFSRITLDQVATGIKKDKHGRTVIGHFKYDSATVQRALETARGGTQPIVQDIMNGSQAGRDVIAFVQNGTKIPDHAAFAQEKWRMEYDAAIAEFKAGHYEAAAQKFEAMVKEYPNDGLLLNDLATTYIKIGEYEKALECTSKIFTQIKDKSQYAAAYYNAGVAREKLGQYQSALANYQNAKKHGNKSKEVESAIARLQSLAAHTSAKHNFRVGAQMLRTRGDARSQKMQNIRTHKSRTYNA
ncbi:MAG: tetratricopeptide repeat protein [Alphaproteobacteria bacterium]|nr:tetratricopeptide repeat protein [Alphaproteobacteria bacterium]